MIKVGDRAPSAAMMRMGPDGMEKIDLADLCAGKKVALFGLPAAFSPKCHGAHVPGYVANADAMRAKGVDVIACVSVNDAFVMKAWGDSLGVGDKVMMLADGNAEAARALGMDMDASAAGMGPRMQRCSLLIDDGVVRAVNLERPEDRTDAETMLGLL